MLACELKTTIPGAPMTGESFFKTTFANKVKANIELDYEYEIIDPVTEQAIDVATAWKIYESKGLQEVGKEVISNRAGANNIVVNQPQGTQPAKTEE
jgi:hypothetical protein